MTLARFHDKGKVPVSKHFLTIKVMLVVITSEDYLRSLGPIPSNPVDLDISSFDIKEKTKFSSISGNSNLTFSGIFEFTNSLSFVKTKFSSISGNLNLTFSGIFELTNSLSFVKAGCVIGSFNLDSMFTK